MSPPGDVFRWIREYELRSGVSKTRLGIAGLIAFQFLGDTEQAACLQWANLLDEGRITWAELQDVAEKTQKERTAALARTLDRLLRYELGEDRTPKAKPA